MDELDCPHGQQKRTCETCELLAERDRLQAVVDALHAASGIDTAGHDRQQVGQQYLSNACIHEQHDQCDEECIYCHDGCACSCHPWNATHRPAED